MNKNQFAQYVKKMYEYNSNGTFDRFGREYVENGDLDVELIVDENCDLSWIESHIGTNFGSTKDDGKTYKNLKSGNINEQDLIDDVLEKISNYPRQTDFVEKNNGEVTGVYTGVVVVVRKDGYSIYPDPESKIVL